MSNQKGLQGQYQSNPFFKMSVASQHVAAFFGYVEGIRVHDKDTSELKLAKTFVDKWNLDIDALSLNQRFTHYKLNMLEIKKTLQNTDSKK